MTKSREEKLQYMRDWRLRKKESDPDYWKRNYEKHKNLYLQWSSDNQHLQKERYGHYYNGSEAIKASYRKANKKWRQSPEGLVYKRFESSMRRKKCTRILAKIHATEIREFYKNCPEGMVVDHVVPLNGKNVSGLHVPWNLQYLSPLENGKKGNKH